MFKTFSFQKKSLLATSLVLALVLLLPNESLAQTAGTIESAISTILWSIVSGVFGTFVAFAGWILDEAIGTFVVGFGQLYATSGLGFAVDNLWSTVRDIFNLTFIFGLVYIGFKMILKSGDSSARQTLGTLVAAALLVNFSLFITKFIIDFSNILAAQFAAAFKTSTGSYAVAESFMNLLGISNVLQAMPSGSGFVYIFGSLILFLVATFVFGAGGIILMIRFAVLNIYMVLSPLMFLGWVFPGFSGVSKDYWKGFISRAFYAPAYILMLYLANQILVNMQGVTNGAKLSTVFEGAKGTQGAVGMHDSFVSTVPYFILTCVFLIASLVVASKMGAEGATSAVAIGKRWSNKARSMATNTATRPVRSGARLGLNWAGTKLEKNLNNHQARTGWRAGFAKLNAVDKFERGLATKLQGAQLGTGTTNKAEKEYAQKTQSRANQTKAENDRKKEYSDNIKALEVKTKTDAELKTALEKLGIAIKGMSKDEKNKLDLEELKNQSVAIHLTDDDIKNLNESGKYSASEIDEIKSSRKSAYKSVATHGSTLTHKDAAGATVHSHGNAATIDMRSKIASLGSREVGKLPIEIFKEEKMFAHITPAMLDERMRNGIDAADLPQIRAALADHLRIPLNSTPSTAQVNGINMLLTSNPWVKWENGNSNYAAQFFA